MRKANNYSWLFIGILCFSLSIFTLPISCSDYQGPDPSGQGGGSNGEEGEDSGENDSGGEDGKVDGNKDNGGKDNGNQNDGKGKNGGEGDGGAGKDGDKNQQGGKNQQPVADGLAKVLAALSLEDDFPQDNEDAFDACAKEKLPKLNDGQNEWEGLGLAVTGGDRPIRPRKIKSMSFAADISAGEVEGGTLTFEFSLPYSRKSVLKVPKESSFELTGVKDGYCLLEATDDTFGENAPNALALAIKIPEDLEVDELDVGGFRYWNEEENADTTGTLKFIKKLK